MCSQACKWQTCSCCPLAAEALEHWPAPVRKIRGFWLPGQRCLAGRQAVTWGSAWQARLSNRRCRNTYSEEHPLCRIRPGECFAQRASQIARLRLSLQAGAASLQCLYLREGETQLGVRSQLHPQGQSSPDLGCTCFMKTK